jgi:hypothetical protein
VIHARSSVSAEVVVEKALFVTVDGYRRAVRRIDDAIAKHDVSDVYITFTEAVNWLKSFADRTGRLQGDATRGP